MSDYAQQNGAEPAFPLVNQAAPNGDFIWGAPGLTKREYIAVATLQGMLASSDCNLDNPVAIVSHAMKISEALLKELSK